MTRSSIFLPLLILSATLFVEAMSGASSPRTCHDVRLVNFIPSINVVVHCMANEKDLKFRRLLQNKQFHYLYCEAAPGVSNSPSRSNCLVIWGDSKSNDKIVNVDIFNTQPGSSCTGAACYWAIQTDGVYYSDTYPPTNLVKKYSW